MISLGPASKRAFGGANWPLDPLLFVMCPSPEHFSSELPTISKQGCISRCTVYGQLGARIEAWMRLQARRGNWLQGFRSGSRTLRFNAQPILCPISPAVRPRLHRAPAFPGVAFLGGRILVWAFWSVEFST
jgi:hypothetical protein